MYIEFSNEILESFGNKINFKFLDKDQIILDNNACWDWNGYIDKKGYGHFCINKKIYLAHRMAYMMDIGNPGKSHVLHDCKNFACVNPNHLFLKRPSNISNCDFSKSDLNRFNKTVNFVYLDKNKTSLNHRDCWNWLNVPDGGGYGIFSIDGKSYSAHRIAYMIENGKIPSDMYVCHSCDNPACVNPSHLWLGTPDDDVQDKVNKNRQFVKLTTEDITEILSGIYNDEYTNISQITDDYDISKSTIKSILMGESRTKITYHITNKLGTTLQYLYEKMEYYKDTGVNILDESKVYKIKRLLNETNWTQKAIAEYFNVDPYEIYCIKENKLWTDVIVYQK